MKVETSVISDDQRVNGRLEELCLDRQKLMEIVVVALAERANATPYHPSNAAGTFAYQHATFALRSKFVGADWSVDRSDGVEAIRSDKSKIKVAFSNVDVACDLNALPKPRSDKGAGSERAAMGNLFGETGLPHFTSHNPREGYALYYLMVDENGLAELTRPVVQNSTFTGAVERLFLGSGKEWSAATDDDSDAIDNFDPEVARKAG